MKLLLATAIALALALVVHVERAEACSCIKPELAKQLADSALVFVGTAGERVETKEGAMASFADYTFAVDRSFKGDAGDSVTIRTSGNSAMCGASFQAGSSYIVYANERQSRMWTGLCAGNTLATPELIAEIEAELGLGGEADPPTDDPQPPPTDDPPPPPANQPPPAATKGNPACGGCTSGSSGGGGLALAFLAGLLVVRPRRSTPR